jgi:subtilase family serine protease
MAYAHAHNRALNDWHSRAPNNINAGIPHKPERTGSTLEVPMTVRRLLAAMITAAMAQACLAGTIAHNTPGFVKNAPDLGAVDPSTVISVTAWLEVRNKDALDNLVKQQKTPGSAQYHAWITQEQFNSAYGPTANQVNAVENFLAAHNFTVLAVAENNMYVKVQGTVAEVEQTFHVQIHNFNVNGVTHRSNTADPSVDPAGGLIAAVTGMDDLGYDSMVATPMDGDGTPIPARPLGRTSDGLFFESQCLRAPETQTFTAGADTATYTGERYGADITNGTLGHLPPCGFQPSEIRTAYDMNPLYAAGLDGTGETVVIVDAFGSPTIQTDAEVFSQLYGLPDLTPANFQVLRAPGAVHHPSNGPFGGPNIPSWMLETTLDVEWVHAMAPGANIVLVISPNNTSDLDETVNYAVVHHLGNTISNSWGGPEGRGNPAGFIRVERILEMGAAEGMDVNFSSGDSGDFVAAVGFATVSYPSSSTFATGVGGTSLFLNPDNTRAVETGWGNNLTRIADRIALGSPPVIPPLQLGFQGGAGGGTSLNFAKPAFQAGIAGSMRQVPDIGWLADPFTGVEFIQTVGGQLSVGVIGGTSVACPMFSALMAIAAQKAGHPLGQAAPLLYNLPAGAVNDVLAVSSPNNVIGVIDGAPVSADALAAPLGNTVSYLSTLYNSPFSTRWFVLTFGTDSSLTTGPGWDNVTGVGTPDGFNFVNAVGH